MKPLVRLLLLTVPASLISGLVTWRVLSRLPAAPPSADGSSAAPTIEGVRRLSSLTTLRVEVSDVRVTELRGHTGGTRAVLLVRGQVFVGVDLSAARFASVDHARRAAVLELPPPSVQAVRLDHGRTKLLGVWTDGLWAVTPGGREADAATTNAAYREAERSVAAAAAEPAHAAIARAHAEAVLRAFVEAMGWTVDVRWSHPA